MDAHAGELVGRGRGRRRARRPGDQPGRRPLPRSSRAATSTPAAPRTFGPDVIALKVETRQSNIVHRRGGPHPRLPRRRAELAVDRGLYQMEDYIQQVLAFDVQQGRAGAGREDGRLLHAPGTARSASRWRNAGKAARRYPTLRRGLRRATRAAWDELWRGVRHARCPSDDRVQLLLRLHIAHVLQVCSRHTADHDAGVPARGLNGEAYRGHVFWDELLRLPVPQLPAAGDHPRAAHVPVPAARARRARRRAKPATGARCSRGRAAATAPRRPRSSTSTRSRASGSPTSATTSATSTRRSSTTSGTTTRPPTTPTSCASYGAEMMLEIARFWASIAHFNPERDRYEIHGVMGPDEFHEKYPGAAEGGPAQQRLHQRHGGVDLRHRAERARPAARRAGARRCATGSGSATTRSPRGRG